MVYSIHDLISSYADANASSIYFVRRQDEVRGDAWEASIPVEEGMLDIFITQAVQYSIRTLISNFPSCLS